MSRLSRLLAMFLGTVVVAVILIAMAAAVSADTPSGGAPTRTGWWTTTNTSGAKGSLSASVSPDVRGDDLLVEGGPHSTSGANDTGAIAYAAVVYEVPEGSSVGNLTLGVSPNSASVPISTLELCPLVAADFTSQYGGPSSDAPKFSCSDDASASSSLSGSSYVFNVASLVTNGILAVAVLPTGPSDRVVLSPPDAQSLSVTSAVPEGAAEGASGAGSGSASGAVPLGSNPLGSAGSSSPLMDTGVGVGGSNLAQPATSALEMPGGAPTAGGSAQRPVSVPSPSRRALGSQFETTESTAPKAAPLAVALLVAAAVVGGWFWLAAGRAALRRARVAEK